MTTLKDVRDNLRELAAKLESGALSPQEIRAPLLQVINNLQEIEAEQAALDENREAFY